MTITSMLLSKESHSSKAATESKSTTESKDELSYVSAESRDESAEPRDERNAVERFFSEAASAFSVALDEATSFADDVHTIITAEDEESVTREDEICDVQTTEVKHEVKNEVKGKHSTLPKVKGKHSTLAKKIKKLGKLEQVVEKAEKQIIKAKKQINAAEEEQKRTRKMIQAHSVELLSMVEDPEELVEEDEPDDDYEDEDEELSAFESIQRFFASDADAAADADADEEQTVVKATVRKEKVPVQNGQLKGSNSIVTKKIKKLGKLEQVVKRAKKQIVKSEKQIKYAEEEQQKTRKIINILSARCGLSIGTSFEEDDGGKRKTDDTDDLGELVTEGDDGFSSAGEGTLSFVPQLASSVDKAVNKAIFPHD